MPMCRANGDCAYIDNTGQQGWFNYHCDAVGANVYKINFICEQEGENIADYLQMTKP